MEEAVYPNSWQTFYFNFRILCSKTSRDRWRLCSSVAFMGKEQKANKTPLSSVDFADDKKEAAPINPKMKPLAKLQTMRTSAELESRSGDNEFNISTLLRLWSAENRGMHRLGPCHRTETKSEKRSELFLKRSWITREKHTAPRSLDTSNTISSLQRKRNAKDSPYRPARDRLVSELAAALCHPGQTPSPALGSKRGRLGLSYSPAPSQTEPELHLLYQCSITT